MTPERPRLGRRPGPSTTREEILAAATAEFAEVGPERATIRAIAARAGVDPALIYRFFDGKDGLIDAMITQQQGPLVELMASPETSSRLLAHHIVRLWEDPRTQALMMAGIRTATSSKAGAQMLRRIVRRTLFKRLVAVASLDRAELRASLVESHLLGILMARHVLKLPGISDVPAATLEVALTPVIEHYLHGPLEPRPRA